MVVATSGVPVHDHLFNASVCVNAKDRGFEGTGKGWQSGSPGPLDAVDPVVIPSTTSPGKLDTVFMLSNGRITSLGPSGERNWQTQTSAIWRKAHVMLATGDNHEAGLRADSVAVPSLHFINLHAEKSIEAADDEDLQLLAVGDSNLAMLATDGRVRATMGLPQQPVGAPALGDFNDDGVIDIVLVSSGGYFAFALERRPNVGGALFAALIAILLVILGAVWAMNIVDFDLDDDWGDRKGVRSTDDDWED